MADLAGKIQIWSQLAATFSGDNPTLERGQFAYEYDTKKLKCGDGVTAYNALAYIGAVGGVVSVTGTANRITVDLTDPTNPVLNIASAYDTAITNEITAATGQILPTIPIISNNWRGTFGVGNQTAGTWVAGSAWCVPYYVEKSHYVTGIRAHVTTSVAATTIRLGLYDSANYIPVNLLDQSGAIPASTAGILSYTFGTPIHLTAGLYWMSIQVSASTVGLRNFQNGIMACFPRTSDQPFTVCRFANAYGAFLNPASGITYITGSAGNTPVLELLVQ